MIDTILLRIFKNFWLAAIVNIFFVGFCSAQNGDWAAPDAVNQLMNPVEGDLKATMKGKKIYQKLCWSCHGMEGNGMGPAAAALTIKPSNYSSEKVKSQSDGAIYWKISNGRGQMASYDQTLSEDQRWMLVNYIRQLGNNPSY